MEHGIGSRLALRPRWMSSLSVAVAVADSHQVEMAGAVEVLAVFGLLNPSM